MTIPIPSYHKVFTLGDKPTHDIFKGPIEISSKWDGSQASFGRVNGEVHLRSKGAEIFHGDSNKMFDNFKEVVRNLKEPLPEGLIFHCEYIRAPRHNTLTYARVPKNFLGLFGITYLEGSGGPIEGMTHREQREAWAEAFGIEPIPVLFEGKAPEGTLAEVRTWIHENFVGKPSELGGCPDEGVVIKNFSQSTFWGDRLCPITCAKIVTAAFKEKHLGDDGWKKTQPNNLDRVGNAFNTVARWEKARQYLRDCNQLQHSVKDIGVIIKRIQEDIQEEDRENIKELLWVLFKQDLMRMAVRGFPEWYKGQLIEGAST